MGKRIALDFDGTYTAMPGVWDIFIKAAKNKGHKVTIVTARAKSGRGDPEYNSDIEAVEHKHNIDAVYTNGEQKADHFKADIWIDDNPDWIVKMSLIKSMALLDDAPDGEKQILLP